MSSEYLPRSQKSYSNFKLSSSLSLKLIFFSTSKAFFSHNELKWPHVDAKYLLIFLHFLFFFFLKYIRCCSNCSLHAVHFDDQRPEAVSVWPEFLHWTCQQILGICICAKQSTWTRWVPCLPFSCYAYLEQNKESTLSKCHQVQCCSFSSASLAVCLKNSWAFVVVSKLLFLQLIWQSVKPWDWLL